MTATTPPAGTSLERSAAGTAPEPLRPADRHAHSWAELVTRLLAGEDLTDAHTAWAMSRVVDGTATSAQVAGFLIALRAKGETGVEIGGLVQALLGHATRVKVPGTTVDIAGTGGDRSGAVNVSTMSAIVAAAAGVRVVKHGGRAASSSTSGSADVLDYLGVTLDLPPERAARVAVEAGITFLFAPRYNPGLRHVTAVRRDLAVPTAFNILGPLVNPALPTHQVVGVADARMAPVIAEVLALRGASALVVRGDDGLDKLTTATASRVWVVRDGVATPTRLDPRDLGIPPADRGALRGGDAAENARVVQALLDGQRGPVRDVVLLNAAAVLAVAEPDSVADAADSLVEWVAAHLARCAEAVDSGAARETLRRWVAAARTAGEPKE